jgi:hypothetical protein
VSCCFSIVLIVTCQIDIDDSLNLTYPCSLCYFMSSKSTNNTGNLVLEFVAISFQCFLFDSMKSALLLWLALSWLCTCSRSGPNMLAMSAVGPQRKKTCVCTWSECQRFSDVLAKYDSDWSGVTHVNTSQIALVSSIKFHLNPLPETFNKATIKVARHHWYRQLVVDNLKLSGANPLAGSGLVGEGRKFSKTLTRVEAQQYHERMVDGANTVLNCLKREGEVITEDLERKFKGLFVQAPLVSVKELESYVKQWEDERGRARAERVEERRLSMQLPAVTPSVRKVIRPEHHGPAVLYKCGNTNIIASYLSMSGRWIVIHQSCRRHWIRNSVSGEQSDYDKTKPFMSNC